MTGAGIPGQRAALQFGDAPGKRQSQPRAGLPSGRYPTKMGFEKSLLLTWHQAPAVVRDFQPNSPRVTAPA